MDTMAMAIMAAIMAAIMGVEAIMVLIPVTITDITITMAVITIMVLMVMVERLTSPALPVLTTRAVPTEGAEDIPAVAGTAAVVTARAINQATNKKTNLNYYE